MKLASIETIKNNICDIVLIADEPARAEFISFTDAYVEIGATYIVPQNSPVKIISDVDQFQNRQFYDTAVSQLEIALQNL